MGLLTQTYGTYNRKDRVYQTYVLSICAHKLYNIITLLTLLALESTLSRRSGATKVHMRKMDDLGRRCCQGLKIVLPQSVTQRRCLSQFQSLYHPPARVRTQYVEANLNKKLYSGQERISHIVQNHSKLKSGFFQGPKCAKCGE